MGFLMDGCGWNATRSDVKVHNDVILKGRSSLVLIFMGTGAEVFDCNSYICIHTVFQGSVRLMVNTK